MFLSLRAKNEFSLFGALHVLEAWRRFVIEPEQAGILTSGLLITRVNMISFIRKNKTQTAFDEGRIGNTKYLINATVSQWINTAPAWNNHSICFTLRN